eukprot:Nk52_evm9s48 gene=Nk52_evmTU9s48
MVLGGNNNNNQYTPLPTHSSSSNQSPLKYTAPGVRSLSCASSASSHMSPSSLFGSARRLLVCLLLFVAFVVFLEQAKVIQLSNSREGRVPIGDVGDHASSIGINNNPSVDVTGDNKIGGGDDNQLRVKEKGDGKKNTEAVDVEKSEKKESKKEEDQRKKTTPEKEGEKKDIKIPEDLEVENFPPSHVCPELIYKDLLTKRRVKQRQLRESASVEVLQSELGGVGGHRFRLKETLGKNGEKFLIFLFAGGLNNGLLSLENAMPMAAYLNRTLVVPFVTSDHARGLGGTGSAFSRFEKDKHMPKERVRLIGNETAVTEATMELLKKMKFTHVNFRRFDSKSTSDVENMEKMAFQSYFRLNDVYKADKMKWKLRNSAKETPEGKEARELRVAFMEDNPEFWAEQDIYCPSWSPWKEAGKGGKYWETDEFRFLNEREDILCAGHTYGLSKPIVKGFQGRDIQNRMVVFSDELSTTAHRVLADNDASGRFRPGNYVAVHIRRGDWMNACKSFVRGKPKEWRVCFPSYMDLAELYNEVVTNSRSLESLLSADPGNKHKNMTAVIQNHTRQPFKALISKSKNKTFDFVDSFPTYVATNEKDDNILKGLKHQFRWDTAKDLMFDEKASECRSVSYPLLRAVMDMALMYDSGAFIGNEWSSFSRRVKYLRNERKNRPNYSVRALK